jgi:hypothetical protein
MSHSRPIRDAGRWRAACSWDHGAASGRPGGRGRGRVGPGRPPVPPSGRLAGGLHPGAASITATWSRPSTGWRSAGRRLVVVGPAARRPAGLPGGLRRAGPRGAGHPAPAGPGHRGASGAGKRLLSSALAPEIGVTVGAVTSFGTCSSVRVQALEASSAPTIPTTPPGRPVGQRIPTRPPAGGPAVPAGRPGRVVCSYPLAKHAELSVFVVGGASAGYGVRGVEFGD